MPNELLWEIEVEAAHEALACTGDDDAFRSDLRRLGFDEAEIARELEEWRA